MGRPRGAGNDEDAERAFQAELRAAPQRCAAGSRTRYRPAGAAAEPRKRARHPLLARRSSLPRLTAASALLGQILYASGELDGAIALYERATRNVSGVPQMRQRLDQWRAEAARLHAGRRAEWRGALQRPLRGTGGAHACRRRACIEVLESGGPADRRPVEHVSAARRHRSSFTRSSNFATRQRVSDLGSRRVLTDASGWPCAAAWRSRRCSIVSWSTSSCMR